MSSVSRIASSALVGLAMFMVLSRSARAQTWKSQNLHVLEIDSDDADEQAEALTSGLRSRVRSATGWVLLETTQPFSMLAAALRCPKRPDAGCLQRIGDQIKSDRFVWGTLSKAPGHQVTADMHLWMRGKPDVAVKETYSDNLKDNDDSLRKIASRIFDRLTGGPAGTIVVHAREGGGTLTVDGERSGTLNHGLATVLVNGDAHVIEVSAPGFVTASQKAVVAAGSRADVKIELTPEVPPPAPEEAPKPRSTRRALAWTGIIGGSVLIATGGALAIVFESSVSALNTDRQNNYGNATQGATIDNPCSPPAGESNLATASGCNARNLAQAVVIPEIAALSAGGVLAIVGITLLVTDHKQPPSATAVLGLKELRLLPDFGVRGPSLWLSASF